MNSNSSGGGGGEEDDWGQFASPPCFMHELDPFYRFPAERTQQDRDVARWRKSERERLLAARLALAAEERERQARRIASHLDAILAFTPAPLVVGAYWPVRGEPDLLPWMAAAYEKGARIALPAVTRMCKPLVFREWRPDAPLKRGIGNIPFPAEAAEAIPTAIIAPMVGFDSGGYRLGYGDGLLDRTLAALCQKPLLIGVGYCNGLIPTIYPQDYDIPMDWIATGGERFNPGLGR